MPHRQQKKCNIDKWIDRPSCENEAMYRTKKTFRMPNRRLHGDESYRVYLCASCMTRRGYVDSCGSVINPYFEKIPDATQN